MSAVMLPSAAERRELLRTMAFTLYLPSPSGATKVSTVIRDSYLVSRPLKEMELLLLPSSGSSVFSTHARA